MATATLGGLIKDHRLKKRLSQLEVSLRIGWKDTTRLSKIEQGRVGKPTRATIEKIMHALALTQQEKGEFLYVGGYLPTDEEVKKVVKELCPRVDAWQFSAYIMDFSWRILFANTANLKLFNSPPSMKKYYIEHKPNALAFPFLLRESAASITIEKGEDAKNLKPFMVAQIAAFKTETHMFQNEAWYKKLVQSLMKYEDFRTLWPKISQKDYHKKLLDYEYKRITSIRNGKKRSEDFHIFTARLINDPRFQIVFYYPAI